MNQGGWPELPSPALGGAAEGFQADGARPSKVGGLAQRKRQADFLLRQDAEEAKQKLEEAKDQLAAGALTADRILTTEEYLTKWLAGKESSLEASTWRTYEQAIRTVLIPALGRYKLNQVSIEMVNDTFKALGKDHAPSYVQKILETE